MRYGLDWLGVKEVMDWAGLVGVMIFQFHIRSQPWVLRAPPKEANTLSGSSINKVIHVD
jgi:hypothetical protein